MTAEAKSTGVPARADRSQGGQPSLPGTLELVLFKHQDGRYAAAMPGADFLAGDPNWHRAGPIAVHDPDAVSAAANAQDGPHGVEEHVFTVVSQDSDRADQVKAIVLAMGAIAAGLAEGVFPADTSPYNAGLISNLSRIAADMADEVALSLHATATQVGGRDD